MAYVLNVQVSYMDTLGVITYLRMVDVPSVIGMVANQHILINWSGIE